MYILRDGTEVTRDQIKSAFDAGKAVLVHGRADNRNTTDLMLDGRHFDTRGECYSMWEEMWTRSPQNLSQALSAAKI